MVTKLEVTNAEFDEGCRLKDIARKDINHVDVYVEASKHMETASALALEIADDSSFSEDLRTEVRAYGLYYLFEEHSCMGSYYYEKYDIGKCRTRQEQGLKALDSAIDIVENIPGSVSEETSKVLKDHLPTWRYIRKAEEASIHASEARGAWDTGDLISALDHYRENARIQSEAISMTEKSELPLSYRRIAIGNYLGMMANASSVLTQIILQKGTACSDGTTKLLSQNAAIDLIRYALDALRRSELALHENPEWGQYRELVVGWEVNIRNFLSDNKSSWFQFYLALEHEPEFLRIMKMTDLQKYKSIEIERHFEHNKVAKLWSMGSFWVLVVIILTALVMYVAKAGLSWWQLLIAISTIETLLLVIMASTLKSMGDLSEKEFLKLMGVAMKYQLQVFQTMKKRKRE